MASKTKIRENQAKYHGRLTIKAVPPFDFDLSCRIFARGDAQFQSYTEGRFRRVVRINGQLALTVIRSRGTLDQPMLAVELFSNHNLTQAVRTQIRGRVEHILNLKFNLSPFYASMRRDPVLVAMTRKLRGLKSPSTETPFEAVVSSIIEQQISLRVAWSMQAKMITKFGDPLHVDREVYYAFPTPGRLAAATVHQLRDCGLSNRKAEYIIGVSQLIAEGNLDLDEMVLEPSQLIIERLTGVRGIGRWTSEMTMIRGMQKQDVLPADDLGLRRLMGHYYNEDRPVSADEARAIAEPWGRWKGLAAYYLIVAWITDTGI